VNAQLWLDSTMLVTAPMTLISTSTFAATIPLPQDVDSTQLTLWVTAVQRKAANVGAASFALG
jgi:hypothetical protein